jgi:TRAP-type C4-dicarboxylate transport system permease small subunit
VSALGKLLEVAERCIERISQALGVAAAAAVAGIVVLLAGSSIQRYLIGNPIPITEELVALLFAALSFLSIAEGFVRNQQIRLEIVWRRLPPVAQGWAIIIGQFFSLAVIILLGRWTFDFAFTSLELGSRSYVSEILLWPWMMLVPVSLGVLALAVFVRALVNMHALVADKPVREVARAATPDERWE